MSQCCRCQASYHPTSSCKPMLQLMLHGHVCCHCRLSSYWDVLVRPPPGVSIHLVRGEKSDRWTPHMLQQLDDAAQKWDEAASEQPEAVGEFQVHVLERAGHWLQADNPEGLQALIEPWFKDLHQNRLLF